VARSTGEYVVGLQTKDRIVSVTMTYYDLAGVALLVDKVE